MKGQTIAFGALVVAGLALSWLLFFGLPRWYGRPVATTPTAAAAPASPAPAPPGRKIKARLLYLAEDGTRLSTTERDVPYGEGTVEQARQIIEAQIEPVTEPLVSAIPPGTRLRAVFVTSRGDAYVDLSHEAARPTGALDEALTVYTIVDALTTNLPAIKQVQVLVEGKAVETLAGHVDLRRPLARNLDWIQ